MKASPSPTRRFQPIEPHNIPELLRKLPRWLCWRAGPTKLNGKFDKCPVDPSTGRKINGRDPKHWRTFNEVMGGYLRGIADGIGFALSDQHAINIGEIDFYVTVVDFDQCAAKMDEIHRLWRELSEPLTELSPSGKGLHMWGLSRVRLKGGNAGAGRELYSGWGFITMTGIGAIGNFGECPGFVNLEAQWFQPTAMKSKIPPPPPVTGFADLPSNLVFGHTGDHWFDRLSLDEKNACLVSAAPVAARTLDAELPPVPVMPSDPFTLPIVAVPVFKVVNNLPTSPRYAASPSIRLRSALAGMTVRRPALLYLSFPDAMRR